MREISYLGNSAGVVSNSEPRVSRSRQPWVFRQQICPDRFAQEAPGASLFATHGVPTAELRMQYRKHDLSIPS